MDIMDYITSITSFFNFILAPFQYNNHSDNNQINNTDNHQIDNNQINYISNQNNYIYIFINTANIYEATEMMLERLNEYNNRIVIIYLLKSHSLELLFDKIIINDENIEIIKRRMSTKRRHLHTLVDAIDSFIEYNKIIFKK